MAARNRTGTIRVPLSLDPSTNGVLEEMAHLGLFGKNKAEVAVTIIRAWVWDNDEKLNRQGVDLSAARRQPFRKVRIGKGK